MSKSVMSWLPLCGVVAVSTGMWAYRSGDSPSLAPADLPAERGTSTQGPESPPSTGAGPGEEEPLTLARAAAEPGAVSPAAARYAELAAMSETFREGVFLVAIREAGYVCYHLIGSTTSGGDDPIWTVTCDEALAYLVGVDAAGDLIVEPMLVGDGARDWQLPEGQYTDPNRPRLPLR